MAYKYKWVPSPNFTRRLTKRNIDKAVLHWTVGTLASTDRHFQNKASRVSAHYGVENNNVHQYVRDNNIAWHSGKAEGNAHGLGIEISAAPGRVPSDATYRTLATLVASACKLYGLNPDRDIVPHSLYVATRCPGTDKNGKVREKGGVDVARVKRDVKAILAKQKPATKPKPAKKPTKNKKSITTLAREVIAGKWGNGPTRKNRLKKAGYSYSAVQRKVNELLRRR